MVNVLSMSPTIQLISVFVGVIQDTVEHIVPFNTNATARIIPYAPVLQLMIDLYVFVLPVNLATDVCLKIRCVNSVKIAHVSMVVNVGLWNNVSDLPNYFHVSARKGLVELDAK